MTWYVLAAPGHIVAPVLGRACTFHLYPASIPPISRQYLASISQVAYRRLSHCSLTHHSKEVRRQAGRNLPDGRMR